MVLHVRVVVVLGVVVSHVQLQLGLLVLLGLWRLDNYTSTIITYEEKMCMSAENGKESEETPTRSFTNSVFTILFSGPIQIIADY